MINKPKDAANTDTANPLDPPQFNSPRHSKTVGVNAAPISPQCESSPDYTGALFLLNDKTRVVLCARGIQYILQRKYAGGFRGATWKPLGHHTTRKSLARACERLGLLSEASAQQGVDDLPEYAHHLGMIAPKGSRTTK